MAHTPTLDGLEEFGIDACIASNEHRNAINTELCRLWHPAELAIWYINPVFEYLDHVITHKKYSQEERVQLTKFFTRLKERRQRWIDLFVQGKLRGQYWQDAIHTDQQKGRI
jgi:hypothetical protein